MTNRIACIFGGLGAVGSATARALVGEGYFVVSVHRRSHAADSAILTSLPHGSYTQLQCDVSQPDEVAHVVREVVDTYGRIDVCIHTAVDPLVRKRIDTYSSEEFRGQFEASLFGLFNVLHEVVPVLERQQSGTVIAITSVYAEPSSVLQSGTAFQGSHRNVSAYVTAKCAMRALLREVSHEVHGSGVRVNAVAPDFMDTPLNADLPRRVVEWGAETRGSGKLMTPDEVARAVVFLTDGSGNEYTGMSVLVDGLAVQEL